MLPFFSVCGNHRRQKWQMWVILQFTKRIEKTIDSFLCAPFDAAVQWIVTGLQCYYHGFHNILFKSCCTTATNCLQNPLWATAVNLTAIQYSMNYQTPFICILLALTTVRSCPLFSTNTHCSAYTRYSHMYIVHCFLRKLLWVPYCVAVKNSITAELLHYFKD